MKIIQKIKANNKRWKLWVDENYTKKIKANDKRRKLWIQYVYATWIPESHFHIGNLFNLH